MNLLRKLAMVAVGTAFMVASAAQPAHAALVTFETSGTFEDTGTNSFTGSGGPNAITVTFNGLTVTDADASDPGSSGSFGTFEVTGGPAATGNLTMGFTLAIEQLLPPGMVDFPAIYSGNINIVNATATVTFSSPLTQEIDGFLYTITTQVLTLGTSSTNSVVSVGGHVIEGTLGNGNGNGQIPEPGLLLLLGMGAVGLGHRFRRRSIH